MRSQRRRTRLPSSGGNRGRLACLALQCSSSCGGLPMNEKEREKTALLFSVPDACLCLFLFQVDVCVYAPLACSSSCRVSKAYIYIHIYRYSKHRYRVVLSVKPFSRFSFSFYFLTVRNACSAERNSSRGNRLFSSESKKKEKKPEY